MNEYSIIILDAGIAVIYALGFFIGGKEIVGLEKYKLFSVMMLLGFISFLFEILDAVNPTLISRLFLVYFYITNAILFQYAYKLIIDKRKLFQLWAIIIITLSISSITAFLLGEDLKHIFHLIYGISLAFYSFTLLAILYKSVSHFRQTKSLLILFRTSLLLPFFSLITLGFLYNLFRFFSVRIIQDTSIFFFGHVFVLAALGISFTLEGASSIIQELESLSQTDTLTNLPNRRYFQLFVSQIRENDNKHQKLHYIAVLDLDFFKKINDNYGHDAGDMTLKEIARYLKTHIRGNDIVARFGGEEFIVFVECDNEEEAPLFAERLRKGINSLTIMYNRKIIKITTSIGMAHFRSDIESVDSVFKRADRALYDAKNGGRNQYIIV